MTDTELMARAAAMLEYAYVPYSGFPVGAALLCEDGTVYTGCNVENAAYGSAICAERVAALKAVSEGQRKFNALAVTGRGDQYCFPCGACRQFLYEFAPKLKILVGRGDGTFLTTTLDRLLPNGFGPETLASAAQQA
ncbi:MAG: cytidine deaminase [Oscillospiraceae bacterium]|nr:cytidine deaminase [Oscillospiraceae bacterium]